MRTPVRPLPVLALLVASTLAVAQPGPAAPQTVAEASGWTQTSKHADVLAFVDGLKTQPHAGRLALSSIGKSGEGRDLVLVIAAEPRLETAAQVMQAGKLRVLINANIHGGEVEGKEATQMLLREIARGQHEDILRRAVVLWVPDFNADGNDAFGPAARNRRDQFGPDPVGQRRNAGNLDLNRDFVKAESPEVQGLLGAFRHYDPHLFMDLHTTNGSHHGYHLTYSPSLSPNVDASLDAFSRKTFLPEVRSAVLDGHDFRVFDYGNFSRGDERKWSTYDHRPRYGTNYVGLRNRIAVLSEAYSYLSFEQRTAVTRAFVLENLRAAVRHADTIEKLCAAADQRAIDGGEITHGYGTALAPPVEAEVLVGSVEQREGPGGAPYLVANAEFERVRMPTQLAFKASDSLALPIAWALPSPPEKVAALLQLHGVQVRTLGGEFDVEAFEPEAVKRSGNRFEGPSVRVTGRYQKRRLTLPADTLVVPAAQPLARLAAQLLEPVSEDSVTTYGLFGDRVVDAEADAPPGGLRFPVVRILSPLPR